MALHAAAQGGSAEVLEWLLSAEVGALRLLEAQNGHGTTFVDACWDGHVECAKVLHRAECDVTAVGSHGQTALHVAAQEATQRWWFGC